MTRLIGNALQAWQLATNALKRQGRSGANDWPGDFQQANAGPGDVMSENNDYAASQLAAMAKLQQQQNNARYQDYMMRPRTIGEIGTQAVLGGFGSLGNQLGGAMQSMFGVQNANADRISQNRQLQAKYDLQRQQQDNAYANQVYNRQLQQYDAETKRGLINTIGGMFGGTGGGSGGSAWGGGSSFPSTRVIQEPIYEQGFSETPAYGGETNRVRTQNVTGYRTREVPATNEYGEEPGSFAYQQRLAYQQPRLQPAAPAASGTGTTTPATTPGGYNPVTGTPGYDAASSALYQALVPQLSQAAFYQPPGLNFSSPAGQVASGSTPTPPWYQPTTSVNTAPGQVWGPQQASALQSRLGQFAGQTAPALAGGSQSPLQAAYATMMAGLGNKVATDIGRAGAKAEATQVLNAREQEVEQQNAMRKLLLSLYGTGLDRASSALGQQNQMLAALV